MTHNRLKLNSTWNATYTGGLFAMSTECGMAYHIMNVADRKPTLILSLDDFNLLNFIACDDKQNQLKVH